MSTWIKEILVDTAETLQPEWCSVCSCFTQGVPARAEVVAGGFRVCRDCAESWLDMLAQDQLRLVTR